MNRPRWNVVVLDEGLRSQLALSEAIELAGGVVTKVADRIEDAVRVISRAKPDVTILAMGEGETDGAEMAEAVTAAVSCPVVLYTNQIPDTVLRRASAAGAMGFLLKPLRTGDIAPTLDLAIARFKDMHRLRQQLADRKMIERAKGLLMARVGLSENQAFQMLRRTAMNRRLPMSHIARSVILAESAWDSGRSRIDGPASPNLRAAPAGNGKAADG
jgi:response regulator NasT